MRLFGWAASIVTAVISANAYGDTCPAELDCPAGASVVRSADEVACIRDGKSHGPVVRCRGGIVFERQEYRDGQPDGLHEIVDSTGRPMSRVPYVRGEVHGTAQSWFPGTDQLRNQTEYVRGQPHGLSRNWHPNGTVETDYLYENGVIEGRAYSWHPNGKRSAITNYRAGKLHGEQHHFHANDTIGAISHFRDGVLHGEYQTFTDDGQPRVRGRYDNGVKVGPWIDHDGAGTAAGTYVAGKRHGEWAFRNGLGELVETQTFDNDVRHGPFRRFEHGRKVAAGAYARGLPVGVWEEWGVGGNLTRRDTFDDGMRVEACALEVGSGKLVCTKPVPYRLVETGCDLASEGVHDIRSARQFRQVYKCTGEPPTIDWRSRRLWVTRTDAESYRLTFGRVERGADGLVVVLHHHSICSGVAPPVIEYRFELLLRDGKEAVTSRVDIVPGPECGPVP